MELTGKNVVVTGGARGMGKKFAVDLKNLGAKSYVVDVVQENLDALKNETGIPGQVVDVSSEVGGRGEREPHPPFLSRPFPTTALLP